MSRTFSGLASYEWQEIFLQRNHIASPTNIIDLELHHTHENLNGIWRKGLWQSKCFMRSGTFNTLIPQLLTSDSTVWQIPMLSDSTFWTAYMVRDVDLTCKNWILTSWGEAQSAMKKEREMTVECGCGNSNKLRGKSLLWMIEYWYESNFSWRVTLLGESSIDAHGCVVLFWLPSFAPQLASLKSRKINKPLPKIHRQNKLI